MGLLQGEQVDVGLVHGEGERLQDNTGGNSHHSGTAPLATAPPSDSFLPSSPG